jgi:hypothetical protein
MTMRRRLNRVEVEARRNGDPCGRGVGRPVLDMLRRAKVGAKLIPLFVTTGKNALADERGGWLVPRQELAGTLQVLLQSRRLRVAPALPHVATLTRELATFQLRMPATAAEEMDAWRQGPHDDLVLAVAVAAWFGQRTFQRFRMWLGPDDIAANRTLF